MLPVRGSPTCGWVAVVATVVSSESFFAGQIQQGWVHRSSLAFLELPRLVW